jgi:hypothetical protein
MKRVPGFLWVTCAGALYLLAELAFNARLLDVNSGLPSEAALSRIEHVGRTLSGVGAALLCWRVWGNSLKRFLWPQLLVCLVVAVPIVYWLQGYVVDTLVAGASTKSLRVATIATSYGAAMKKNEAALAGLEWVVAKPVSADAKTFLIVFAPLLVQSDNLARKVEAQFPVMARRKVLAQFGPAKQFCEDVYGPLNAGVRTFYDKEYRPGSDRAEEQVERWGRERVQRGFDKEAAKMGFKGSIAFGLSWEAFAQHTAVWEHMRNQVSPVWRSSIDPGALRPLMTCPQVTKEVYTPIVESQIRMALVYISAPVGDYTTNRLVRSAGERAIKAVIVPPVALAFSLFFSLLNFIGLVTAFLPWAWASRTFAAAGIGALVVLPMQVNNRITTSAPYQTLVQDARLESPLTTQVIEWVVRAEPVVNSATDVLGALIPVPPSDDNKDAR